MILNPDISSVGIKDLKFYSCLQEVLQLLLIQSQFQDRIRLWRIRRVVMDDKRTLQHIEIPLLIRIHRKRSMSWLIALDEPIFNKPTKPKRTTGLNTLLRLRYLNHFPANNFDSSITGFGKSFQRFSQHTT